MRRSRLIFLSPILLTALACGGGGGGSTPAPTSASKLVYVDPTDTSSWRLVQDAASTSTHLVLDLLAPTGASGQGVTFIATTDTSRSAWSTVNGTNYATAIYNSPFLVGIASVQGSDLRLVVAQSPGTPVTYGASAVVQMELDLASGASTGTVGLSVAQAGHLGTTSTPGTISIVVGSLQAQ